MTIDNQRIPAAYDPHPNQRARADQRRLLVGGSLALLVVAVMAVVGFVLTDDGPATPPVAITRDDPIADLLGWVPATDDLRRAFAVWAPDPGEAGTPEPIVASDPLLERLSLSPLPFTLGRSLGWRDHFGYGALDVTSWIAAGPNGALAILVGDFDLPAIERALQRAGYQRSVYQGVPLHLLYPEATPSVTFDGDAMSAANAVAIFNRRLITAASPELVKQAIDAAQGRVPSLADDPVTRSLTRTLAPLSGLVVVDAADHAVECGVAGRWTRRDLSSPSGRIVAVGYGRLGAGGVRRTLVAVTYAGERSAASAAPAYDGGWLTAMAGGDDDPGLSVHGRLTTVTQTEAMLVAELVDGREAGWVRAGIRFAAPVCEAAAAALPPGTPPAADPADESAFVRAVRALPDAGTDGALTVFDFAATSALRGVTAPSDPSPGTIETQRWLDALAPIPDFGELPFDATRFALWPSTFGLALGSIEAAAELRPLDETETVAVLVGSWDPARVDAALRGLGYSASTRGAAMHYALGAAADARDHPANVAGSRPWRNVALFNDRIYLSGSIVALRRAVDAATGEGPTPIPAGEVAFQDDLLLAFPDATAARLVGATIAWVGCLGPAGGADRPDWLGIAAIWSAREGGAADRAVLALYPARQASIPSLLRDLKVQVRDAPAPRSTDGAAEGAAFAESMGYLGVERRALTEQTSIVVARFEPPPDAPKRFFFLATLDGCAFVADP